MAARVRDFNWASTSLGPIPSWPEPLLTCVNLLLASHHPMFLWWGPDALQFYNDAYRPSLGTGTRHPSALGQPARDCWTEAWASIEPRIDLVMRHGQSTWYENQLVPILRNGHLEDVYWTWSDSPVRDAEGHVLGVLVTCNETTDRVLAERELHQRARDLRESERIGKMGSWRLVLATGDLTWSDEVYRIMEHDPSLPVLNYATNPELSDPDSHRRLQAAVNHCIATGQSYELDVKMYLQHDGRTVWLATRGEPVFGPDGSITELRGSVRDITDRKLVEEALRASEERLQLALETASLGTWSYDAATGLSTGDPTMLNIFGSSLAAGDFAYWIAFVHPDDRQSVGEKFHAAISHNGPYESEYRILRRTDGEVRWIRSRGRVLLQPDKPLCMVVIVEDITERKLTEAALLRTEKLAAVGRLAASIAHEINNPLESVTNLLFLAKSSAIDPQAIDYLTHAEQELSRASAITTQTLRFHRQSSRPTQVTVDDLLVNVLGILRGRFLNANVTVHLRQRTNLSVLCFDGEIRQVLYNLLGNAVDAMQERGGRLFVRSRAAHSHTSATPGLLFTVADTGTGMSPETLTKLFEPFYSTKGVAGTGLGLWISKEIIDRHRGHLRVRSSQHPNHPGTVFTLFLPTT